MHFCTCMLSDKSKFFSYVADEGTKLDYSNGIEATSSPVLFFRFLLLVSSFFPASSTSLFLPCSTPSFFSRFPIRNTVGRLDRSARR